MGQASFETLQVYQLAERLATEVWNIATGWGMFAKDTIGKQLIRAADSIGANIAEGCGRHSHKDNKRFVRIARGSLLETQHWLRRAYRSTFLTPDQTAALHATLEQLAPPLNAN